MMIQKQVVLQFVALFLSISALSSFKTTIVPAKHRQQEHPKLFAATETASSYASLLETKMRNETTTTNTMETASSQNSKQNPLALLEHVNFNVPNHDYILDFYFQLMGFGLDPRVAVNLMDNDQQFGREGLIWASCGPNQFHLPRCNVDKKEVAQKLNGKIGLRYKSLQGLEERLGRALALSNSGPNSNELCLEWFDVVQNSERKTIEIQIQDRYGNVFSCKEGPEKQTQYMQPVVRKSDTDTFENVALTYGVSNESECRGIDYLEFHCQIDTAHKIAEFYQTIFDATTTVIEEKEPRKGGNNSTVTTLTAYISLGTIDPNTQKAEQYLIFRETCDEFPENDGHHIAIYMGTKDTVDFERAFHKAKDRGLLSTNWRDKADVLDLEAARSQSQFRIRDILDLQTGEPIFRLEHELRSINHPTWPGKNQN